MTGKELYELHRDSMTRNKLHIMPWNHLRPQNRLAWDDMAYHINIRLGVEA